MRRNGQRRRSSWIWYTGVLLILSTVSGTSPAEGYTVIGDSPESEDFEPTIAIHPTDHDTMVVAARNLSFGHADEMRCWHTFDGGQNWTLTIIDESIDSLSATGRGDPSLAIAPDGTLYVVYLVAGDVVCTRTPDFWGTFETTVLEDGQADKPFCGLGIDNSDPAGYQFFVSYVQYPVQNAGDVYVSKLDVDDFTFSTPTLLTEVGHFPIPLVDGTGNAYVVWHENFGASGGTIRIRKSANGTTWNSAVTIGQVPIKNGTLIPSAPGWGVFPAPIAAVDTTGGPNDGRIYAAYVTADKSATPITSTDIVVQYSDDEGGTWSEPTIVHSSDEYSRFHPWMSIDPSSGDVAVFYFDSRNGSNLAVQPWVSVSRDGGTTWMEAMLDSQQTDESCSASGYNWREYNGMVFADGVIRAVWAGSSADCDPNPNNRDKAILFATGSSTSLFSPAVLHVPGDFSTIDSAMAVASPGDTIEVDGTNPVAGSFELKVHVKLVPKAGTGVPVLTPSQGSESLISIPFLGSTTIDGFTLSLGSTYSGAGILAELPDGATTKTTINVVDCTISEGGQGISCSYGSLNVQDCTLNDQTDAGIDWLSRSQQSILEHDTLVIAGSQVEPGSATAQGVAASSGRATLSGCTISGTALSGVSVTSGDLSLADCDFSGSLDEGLTIDLGSNDVVTAAGCTFDTNDLGVSGEGGALNLSDCAFTGQTDAAVDLLSSLFTADDITVTLSSAVGSGVRLSECTALEGGAPGNQITNSIFTSGAIGIDAAESYVTVSDCEFNGQSAHGIRAASSQISNSSFYCDVVRNLVTAPSAGSSSRGVKISALYTHGSTVSIENNTIDGWGNGIELVTSQPIPPPFEPYDPEAAPQFKPTLLRNLATNALGVCIKHNDTTFGTLTNNNAHTTQTNAAAYTPSIPQGVTNNYNYAPLYCRDCEDPTETRYTLRIDSPAAPGVIIANLIGARPVTCAWGQLARSATIPAESVIRVLSDVTVPNNKALTIENGVILQFDALDDWGAGSDGLKNELIVNLGGSLSAQGSEGHRIRFESAAATPAEGDWYGIHIKNGGSADLDSVDITDGVYGFLYMSTVAGEVTNTTFSDNQSIDVVAGSGDPSCNLLLADNEFTIGGGNGIEFSADVDDVTVTNCILQGDDSTTKGVSFFLANAGTTPTITVNQILGAEQGSGIYIGTGSPKLTNNSIEDCLYGIRVIGGAPAIGDTSTTSDNNIVDNETGLSLEGQSTTPTVRNNLITGGYQHVYVAGGCDPDLGTASSSGKNNFAMSDTLTASCIVNANPGGTPQVRARGNYFGGCVGGNPPACTSGSVDIGDWTCTEPAARRFGYEVAGGASALVIRSAVPNPTRSGSVIHFSLPDGWAIVEARVFDVGGRLVRTIPPSRFGPGENSLAWDGRSDRGVLTRSGIYFLEMRSSTGLRQSAKIMVSR